MDQRKSKHPESVKEEAVLLARSGWGGATKISKLLSKRHRTHLPVDTVQDWVRKVKPDIDPVEALRAQS